MILKDYDLEVGDAIFTYQDSWLNKKIMWFSKWRVPKNRNEKIAHIAMFIGYDDKGVPQIFEADWRGVRKKSGACYNNKKYVIHVSSPRDIVIDDYRKDKLRMFIKNNIETDYAYTQLLAIAVQKTLNLHRVGDWDKDAVICSECYCNTLKFVWGVDLTKHPESITPLDIRYDDKMKTKEARV
jgi:hypothetical protein